MHTKFCCKMLLMTLPMHRKGKNLQNNVSFDCIRWPRYRVYAAELVVCCKLSELQRSLYTTLTNALLPCEDEQQPSTSSLAAITALKKLCNRSLLMFSFPVWPVYVPSFMKWKLITLAIIRFTSFMLELWVHLRSSFIHPLFFGQFLQTEYTYSFNCCWICLSCVMVLDEQFLFRLSNIFWWFFFS